MYTELILAVMVWDICAESQSISQCLFARSISRVCVCVCVMRKCLCYGDWWLICCARMECDQLRYEGALVNWPPGPRPPLPLRPGFFPPGPPRPGAPFGLQRPPMVTILSCASRLLTLLGCSTALDTSAGCCLLLLMSRGLCESLFLCVCIEDIGEPCKNNWTGCSAVWNVDSGVPRNYVLHGDPHRNGYFLGGHTWACQGMLAVDTLNILDVHEGQQQCGLWLAIL